MTARVQGNRTATPNTPPSNNSLAVGELYVEMATPLRLWAGVPTTVTASGVKMIIDATAQATANAAAVQKAGDTMTGPLVLSGPPAAPAQAANKAYVDGLLVSPIFTGDPRAPTQAPGDNDQSIATTAFTTAAVAVETARATAAEALKAPLASPVFTGDPRAPTPTLGDADTSIATTAFVANTIAAGPPAGALVAASPPAALPGTLWYDSTGGQLYLRYDDGNSQQWVTAVNIPTGVTPTDLAATQNNVGRNKLHNGLFTVAQRGVGPFTSLTNYTVDRWALAGVGDTAAITQVAGSDAVRAAVGDEAVSFMLVNSFTGSAAAGSYHSIQQSIEGVRRLAGKTVVLSFWAACTGGALKLGINYLQSFGTGGSPSALAWNSTTGQSVTLSGTWTRYSVVTSIASASGKTTGTNGNDATFLALAYSSGATNNALFGSVGVQTGSVYLWGCQLEIAAPGQTQPTPLEKLDPRIELSNCQRFYNVMVLAWAGYTSGGAAFTGTFTLPVTMRAAPTVTYSAQSYFNASGAANYAVDAKSLVVQATATALGGANAGATASISADL